MLAHPSMQTWQQQALTETDIVIEDEAGTEVVWGYSALIQWKALFGNCFKQADLIAICYRQHRFAFVILGQFKLSL